LSVINSDVVSPVKATSGNLIVSVIYIPSQELIWCKFCLTEQEADEKHGSRIGNAKRTTMPTIPRRWSDTAPLTKTGKEDLLNFKATMNTGSSDWLQRVVMRFQALLP
jgi:hypothetical protein